jgi:hypothetical protein
MLDRFSLKKGAALAVLAAVAGALTAAPLYAEGGRNSDRSARVVCGTPARSWSGQ